MKKSAQPTIHISVPRQRLTLKRGGKTVRTFGVSTSRFGVGSEAGSFKTPAGRFRIAEKIGGDQPIGAAFKSRKPIRPSAAALQSDDLIMSRILWLDGLDQTNANTHARYIYIHGTNHEDAIGTPSSHGCIRMRNADVAELYELVEVGTPVRITAPKGRARPAKKAEKSVARRD